MRTRDTPNPRSRSTDRFADRRDREERRASEVPKPVAERRKAHRRTGEERRTDDPTSFSREATKRLIKLVEHPQRNQLLKKGSLSCPACGSPLKAKPPIRWATGVIWEVRCTGCSRTLVHQIRQ